MHLVPEQVRKPIKDLRKSLRSLDKRPSKDAVHELRTTSRKVEAASAALFAERGDTPHKLLKSIKPLRTSAGEVRDMDVLLANVHSLLRKGPNPSLERLIPHLQRMRDESARRLSKEFRWKQTKAKKHLKSFSRRLKRHFDKGDIEAQQAHALFNELSRWPRLTGDNLHDFRIKVKELRYMMQFVNGANPEFMSALDRAKVQIGSWHDWAELRTIATELLDPESDQSAIEQITEVEIRRFKSAMRAAQLLRSRYLRAHDVVEFAEP